MTPEHPSNNATSPNNDTPPTNPDGSTPGTFTPTPTVPPTKARESKHQVPSTPNDRVSETNPDDQQPERPDLREQPNHQLTSAPQD